MKKSRKIIKRIAYCFLAIAILLNLIWNSITCLNVEPACEYINSHALEKSHGRAAWHVLGALNAGGKDMILVPAGRISTTCISRISTMWKIIRTTFLRKVTL